eukprot:8609078-Lingulodinium_polyedra.AAC.1
MSRGKTLHSHRPTGLGPTPCHAAPSSSARGQGTRSTPRPGHARVRTVRLALAQLGGSRTLG